MNSLPTSPCPANGSKANLKLVHPLPTVIGKSALRSRKKSRLNKSENVLDQSTASFPVHPPPTPTVGKKTLLYQEPVLNSELSPFNETPKQIGKQFGPPPSPAIWKPSRHIVEWSIMGAFEELVLTIHEQSEWKENALSIGARLELENLDVPGMRQVWKLTVKIPGPSSGVVTKWRRMLLSMNFVEESISPICFDGWTGTLYEWKSKGLPCRSMLTKFG